ncbi:hypothetical protein GGR57DRAFT_281551 [Xylariaceae sp. FL1272]|nr:hypothetical protein GGR57DRAFT_281551 [Xylariaceae sp. FL1272]
MLDTNDFHDYLSSIDCTATYATVQFKDQASFDEARAAWSFLDPGMSNGGCAAGNVSRNVILVANPHPGDTSNTCSDRQPYVVNQIAYDNRNRTAKLYGQAKDWVDAFDGYTFNVSAVSSSANSNSTVQKRQQLNAPGAEDVLVKLQRVIFANRATDGTTSRVESIAAAVVGSLSYNLQATLDMTTVRNTGTFNGQVQIGLDRTTLQFLDLQGFSSGSTTSSGTTGALTSYGNVIDFGIGTIQGALAVSIDASLVMTAQQTVDFGATIGVSTAAVTIGFGNQAGMTTNNGFTIASSNNGDRIQNSNFASVTVNPTIALGVGILGFGTSASAGILFGLSEIYSAVRSGCSGPLGVTTSLQVTGDARAFGGFAPIEQAGANQVGATIATTNDLFTNCL